MTTREYDVCLFAGHMVAAFAPDDAEEHKECVHGDFVEFGVDESLRQIKEAASIIESLMGVAHEINNVPLSLSLGGAVESIRRARRDAEYWVSLPRPSESL